MPFPASLSASGRCVPVVLPTLGLASPLHPCPAKGIDANQAIVTANFKHPTSGEDAVLDPFKDAHFSLLWTSSRNTSPFSEDK